MFTAYHDCYIKFRACGSANPIDYNHFVSPQNIFEKTHIVLYWSSGDESKILAWWLSPRVADPEPL